MLVGPIEQVVKYVSDRDVTFDGGRNDFRLEEKRPQLALKDTISVKDVAADQVLKNSQMSSLFSKSVDRQDSGGNVAGTVGILAMAEEKSQLGNGLVAARSHRTSVGARHF